LYEGPSRVCKHLTGAFFVVALVERLRGGDMISDLPGDEVLAVFPRLADLIRHQEVIRALHSRGSRVKVGLRLDDEADVCEHIWVVEPLLNEGITLVWNPTMAPATLILEGATVYQWDDGMLRLVTDVSQRGELIRRIPRNMSGHLQLYEGVVVRLEQLQPGLTGLDLLYRSRQHASGATYPVFFSSKRVAGPLREPNEWDKVAYVINWSGERLFSPFVPSELYYEGVGLKGIEEPLQPPRRADAESGREEVVHLTDAAGGTSPGPNSRKRRRLFGWILP
jgi:hypothetical protein